MKHLIKSLLCMLPLLAVNAWSAESQPSALTCADFKPTQEALDRFPDLIGACEAVVERDGELYGKFRAVVRRASFSKVTLYLPATDHTFVVEPQSDARVLVGNQKIRPRDLSRGQEIRIYLATSELARPAVEEIALVTETEVIIPHTVTQAVSLPTTASPWPALALGSLLLLGLGSVLRHRRVVKNHV